MTRRPESARSGASPAPDRYWLPDFCSLPILGSILLVTELVVLVIVVAPGHLDRPLGERVVVASLFGEWLALCSVLLLCQLRPLLIERPIALGVAVAYGAVLAIAAAGSALIRWLDHALALGFVAPTVSAPGFTTGVVLVVAIVAAALFRYYYVRAQWQLEVRAQARAQIVALQARIRPHFLFNSMNTIASLIRSRPDQAEHAVEDLAELFRAALGAGEGLRTLGDEFELIRRYLAIEQLRLGDRLRVEIDLGEVPLDAPVPALLLQPLVENAVLHGIQPLAEGGTVSILGRTDAEHVVIEIHNPRPREPMHSSRGNRTALDNIRQRIRYHFGERGKLEVVQGEGYYAVTVLIPRT